MGPLGEGRVIDGDGTPVSDAMVEVWQANAAGRYDHVEDTQADKKIDPNFHGYGRVATGALDPLEVRRRGVMGVNVIAHAQEGIPAREVPLR